MSRSGKAVELWYVSGKGDRAVLEKLIVLKQVAAKVLSCEDLLKAFMDGTASFSEDLDRDPERLSQVEKRILAWLSFIPLKETVSP